MRPITGIFGLLGRTPAGASHDPAHDPPASPEAVGSTGTKTEPSALRSRMALSAGLAGVVFVSVFGSPAAADGPPVFHEFVPDVDPDEPARALGQAASQPAGLEHRGELLSPPDLNAAAHQPPMDARPGDPEGRARSGRRSSEFRPDRLTSLENDVDYYASFNPSVAPFKRVTALDGVRLDSDGETPILYVATAERSRLPVPPPDDDESVATRERFWGRVELDFSRGKVLPLPSVAPDARVLSLRSQPAVDLHVERDGADNFFVVAGGSVPTTPVRLVFLTDAPASYFGMPIPATPAKAQRALVPPMPKSVRARALAFARELGLSPRSDLRTVVHGLVGHFRSFEESAEPPPGDDLYLALARGKKGICRHRSYAFVITAQALGVPARFVQNEAHSWVEVRVMERGYMRIDLGGAPAGLRAHGTETTVRHTPEFPDELPRPPTYEEAYAQANSAAFADSERGEAADSRLAGRWLPTGDGPAAVADPGPGSVGSQATSAADRAALEEAERDPRRPLTMHVDQRAPAVVRGDRLLLSGHVREPGGPGVAGLRVEISLSHRSREERMLLGVTVTDGVGRFRAQLSVPPDLPVGDYRLVVLTPGDAEYRPGFAQ